ncbi:MAG: UPF0182 family protein [Streptosporangiales bacterium]|nr:UPF0182 family protein [Streptosporangiales bacterium]
MTFRTPGQGPGIRAFRRPRLLLPVIAAVVLIVVLFVIFTSIWTDLLWYRSVGYTSVFTTRVVTRLFLFLIIGLAMAVLVGLNMVIAYRIRPVYRPLSVEQQGLERYRTALDPHLRLVMLIVTGAVALFAGSSASGEWRTWMMYANGQSFGVKDFQFGIDISFFAFTYPFLRLVLGYAFATVVLAFIAAAFTHYLYGGLRLQTPGDKASPAARVHLSVLLGIFVLLKAVAYWLDRYGLAYSERGHVTGPSFTDVNATLPAKSILATIAVICAVLFFANIFRRGFFLPIASLGLLVLSAILVGGVYPAIIQQFQVKPNEADREAPYIERNIKATRTAYNVGDVKVGSYDARTDIDQGQLAEDAATMSGIRLLDPNAVSRTYQQLQQIRGFYRFPDLLDIDRYQVDGQSRDMIVALRGLAGPPQGQQNWVNQHVVYTHGFGLVAAPGNQLDENGAPAFLEGDIPPQGDLGDYQPRTYFDETIRSYSIVGAPKGATPRELDFPDESETGQQNTTYTGKGGVPMGSPINRLLFAVKFQDRNILFSDAINDQSRIMYVRDPRARVQKVAPFLKLDGNPYPAIVGGRIQWVVDGYTTSSGYPYSQRVGLDEATRDANTTRETVSAQPRDTVNYIRNSVKATVDAYDGTVTLYQWNEDDPVLKTWMKTFPGIVQPKSKISDKLMAHLRYPEDLFKVQRSILARYHVQEPYSFYGGQDFWRVPEEPAQGGGDQPPYFLSLKMPGQQEPTFSLTTAYVPRNRPNLAAFMAVNAQPGPDYGTIRVLQLPRNTAIPGPGQVQNTFESNPTVARELTLLRGGGAQTVLGNLLTLPLGGGLIYIEPVYVEAAGGESYPILRRVLVSFGNRIGFGPTLEDSLGQVFGEAGVPPTAPEEEGGQQPPPTGGQADEELQAALQDAQTAYSDGQEALRRGDWRAYGEAQEQLQDALERAQQAGQGSQQEGQQGG